MGKAPLHVKQDLRHHSYKGQKFKLWRDDIDKISSVLSWSMWLPDGRKYGNGVRMARPVISEYWENMAHDAHLFIDGRTCQPVYRKGSLVF